MRYSVRFACPILMIAGILNCNTAMTQDSRKPSNECADPSSAVTAHFVAGTVSLNAAKPAPEWNKAQAVTFCSDWQGKNADPARNTTVRVLWNQHTLYLRFECSFRTLYTFDDSDPNGRRDHLWDRDVAEVFLQPDASRQRFYKEVEVAPNGMWIDLDISPGPLQDLKSGMQRSVSIDKERSMWVAEISIPMTALTSDFDPNIAWRVNFYRIEGKEPDRKYFAWRPTNTPEPNFHVPSAFGTLLFSRSPEK
jgi:alpha-galactosidase